MKTRCHARREAFCWKHFTTKANWKASLSLKKTSYNLFSLGFNKCYYLAILVCLLLFNWEHAKENFASLGHCLITGKTEIKRLIFGLRWILRVLVFNTEQQVPVLLINRPTAILPSEFTFPTVAHATT